MQKHSAMLLLKTAHFWRLMEHQCWLLEMFLTPCHNHSSGSWGRNCHTIGPNVPLGQWPSKTSLGAHSTVLREDVSLCWVKDKSSLAPSARAKRFCMCQARIISHSQHRSSGCSQHSCINIIMFFILMIFGFETSWQRCPRTERSQWLNVSWKSNCSTF